MGIAIVAASICTAGAIVATAPAIAGYVGTAAIVYTGSLAVASVASTVVSIGAVAMAIGTVAVGINEGIAVATGYNAGAALLGAKIYSGVSSAIGFGGYMYMYGGAMLPYPNIGNGPSNLKEQLVMEEAVSKPYGGKVIVRNLGDSRFPGWLGWQKYSYSNYGIDVHYVGNKLFPRWYPFSPWFDYKIK